MDSISPAVLTEALKQVPALVVVAYLVRRFDLSTVRFLDFLAAREAIDERMGQETRRVIGANTDALIRAVVAIEEAKEREAEWVERRMGERRAE
jgi:hypothetical protein